MDLASKIQKKCNEVWDENWYEDSKIKKMKAIGAMILSGAVDGAVLAYPIMIGIDIYVIAKKMKDK